MKTPSEEFKNTHKLRFTLLTSLPLQKKFANNKTRYRPVKKIGPQTTVGNAARLV